MHNSTNVITIHVSSNFAIEAVDCGFQRLHYGIVFNYEKENCTPNSVFSFNQQQYACKQYTKWVYSNNLLRYVNFTYRSRYIVRLNSFFNNCIENNSAAYGNFEFKFLESGIRFKTVRTNGFCSAAEMCVSQWPPSLPLQLQVK